MDAALNPPIRLQVLKTTPASPKVTQTHIEDFLANFQSRCMIGGGGGGDTAVTMRLQKLSLALREDTGKIDG